MVIDAAESDLDQAFLKEEIAGELKSSKIGLVVCGVGLLFAVAMVLRSSELALWIAGIAILYACYYFVINTLLQRGIYRRWYKYLTTTLEVSVATIVFIIDTIIISPAYALTSSPWSIYFLAISITALRFKRGLSLYAGVLAAVQASLCFYMVRPLLSAALIASLPSLQWAVLLQRLFYLLLAGLLADIIGRTARRLVKSMVIEIGRRQYLRRVFGRYFSDQVMTQILEQDLPLSGEQREVTVLCTDVRDFTKFSSQRSPAEVVQFLNTIFEWQCDVVNRHGGWIDKFMGDGMLAIFGAPVALENHARSAARAAIELIQRSQATSWDGLDPRYLGIALHSGTVVIGNIGSKERLEYTAIGDTVNLTFRIEGKNRELGTGILISEETRAALDMEMEVVKQPPCQIRGHQGDVQLYELNSFTR